MARLILVATLAIALAAPAHAHKLIMPGFQDKIAKGAFSATASSTWNRLDQKEGKYQEIWADITDHALVFPKNSGLLQ